MVTTSPAARMAPEMAGSIGDGAIYLTAEFGAKIGDVCGVRFVLWGVSGT